MTNELQRELKQTKPFRSLVHEALLSIERTAAVLMHGTAEGLKRYGVTPTQYNALRILRGAGPEGLCRNEIRDRLVYKVPDVTRLLDRLEEAGLVERARDVEDRRQVMTRITPAGLDLLSQVDEPIEQIHRAQLGHMAEDDLRTLIALLTAARGPGR